MEQSIQLKKEGTEEQINITRENVVLGGGAVNSVNGQTGEYTNEFTFGTDPSGKCNMMFRYTGGTFVGNPDQLTYYTANEIIR